MNTIPMVAAMLFATPIGSVLHPIHNIGFGKDLISYFTSMLNAHAKAIYPTLNATSFRSVLLFSFFFHAICNIYKFVTLP